MLQAKKAFDDKYVVNQKLSPNWGERSLTQFHPDLYPNHWIYLYEPVTGSTVHLTCWVSLRLAPTLGITLTGGFHWHNPEGDFQPLISYL